MFDENLLPFIAHLNQTIMFIALTVGLLLFVIGYFAGGKLAKGRIGMCVLLTTIIGALSLSAPVRFFSFMARGWNVKTMLVEGPDNQKTTAAKIKASTQSKSDSASPAASPTDSTAVEGSTVPGLLQALAFGLYLVWTAFLIGMGIFLYETLTVTAEEAEKH